MTEMNGKTKGLYDSLMNTKMNHLIRVLEEHQEKKMLDAQTLEGDGTLIARAMLSLSYFRAKNGGQTLHQAVMSTFGLGSTHAKKLCERFEYDPELRVRKLRP